MPVTHDELLGVVTSIPGDDSTTCWGDGGGGSGASVGAVDGGSNSPLLAKMDQIIMQMKQQEEGTMEQLNQAIERAFACQEKVMERVVTRCMKKALVDAPRQKSAEGRGSVSACPSPSPRSSEQRASAVAPADKSAHRGMFLDIVGDRPSRKQPTSSPRASLASPDLDVSLSETDLERERSLDLQVPGPQIRLDTGSHDSKGEMSVKDADDIDDEDSVVALLPAPAPVSLPNAPEDVFQPAAPAVVTPEKPKKKMVKLVSKADVEEEPVKPVKPAKQKKKARFGPPDKETRENASPVEVTNTSSIASMESREESCEDDVVEVNTVAAPTQAKRRQGATNVLAADQLHSQQLGSDARIVQKSAGGVASTVNFESDDSSDTEGSGQDDNGESSRDDEEEESLKGIDRLEARMRAKSMAACQMDVVLMQMAEDEKLASLSWVQKIVQSPKFDAAAALLLISNTVVIGAQVERAAHYPEEDVPLGFRVVDTLYCAAFLFELLMRIYGRGLWYFLVLSTDKLWNWFDLSVVFLSVLESALQFTTNTSSASLNKARVFGRLIRVVRVVRIVRVVRVMRLFRAFRVLITAIFGTLRSCAWAVILLVLIMYIFAIIFAQSTTDYLVEVEEGGRMGSDNTALRFYYGTLPRSMFTLFKAIIGGVDWQDVVLPLSELGWPFVILFLVYISFIQLAVMNVVAGLFLQSAIEQAQSDQEHVINLRLQEKENLVTRLEDLFRQLDTSRDGSISLVEFEEHLSDEHMQAFLQTFEIENADAWTLFKLLDTDGGGAVDIDEFVEGCIRLKGSAKSIQMCQLMYHHKWIMNKLLDLTELVESIIREVPTREKEDSKAADSQTRKSLGTLMSAH